MADQVDTVDTAERRPGWLNPRFAALTGITLTAAAAHALPHPPNFSPLFAMALFGGAYFANRAVAFAIPLAALFLGDVALGYWVFGRAVFTLMPFVYGSFMLTVLLGLWIRQRRQSPAAIAAAALATSVLFYLISNFGAWLVFDFYPKTLDGLVACYLAGIEPYFRNTLLSNALFTVVLFGGFALAQRLVASLREPLPVVALSQRSSP
jgi:hypothetical protein